MFHYKVGGTDGVSLEIDKWKHVLEEMGHTVHLCAGDLGNPPFCEAPETKDRQTTSDGLA